MYVIAVEGISVKWKRYEIFIFGEMCNVDIIHNTNIAVVFVARRVCFIYMLSICDNDTAHII